MTEQQFTPEYIAFILSDEAKALQALWEPEEGDWFVATAPYVEVEGDDWPEIDIEVGEINSIHSAWRMEGGEYKTAGAWLPTLRQLVALVERTDKTLFFNRVVNAEGKEPIWQVGFHGGWEIFDKDLLLAAAQLAVRAIQGGVA